jgi:hypothetical protein
VDVLRERFESLEREHRRLANQVRLWKRAGTLALVGSLSLVMIVVLVAANHAQDPRVYVAEQYILESKDGKLRGAFGVSDDQLPSLTLHDEAGKTRFRIGLNEENKVSLSFVNKVGKERIVIETSPSGQPSMWFFDSGGNIRLGLSLESSERNEGPFLLLNDEKSMPNVTLSSSLAGPQLSFRGPNIADPLSLGVREDGTQYVLFGREGQHRMELMTLPDGTPSLRMRNKPPRMEKVTLPDGRPAIQLGAKTMPQMEMITLPDGTASLRISDKTMRPASEIPAPK